MIIMKLFANAYVDIFWLHRIQHAFIFIVLYFMSSTSKYFLILIHLSYHYLNKKNIIRPVNYTPIKLNHIRVQKHWLNIVALVLTVNIYTLTE